MILPIKIEYEIMKSTVLSRTGWQNHEFNTNISMQGWQTNMTEQKNIQSKGISEKDKTGRRYLADY